MTLVGSHAKAGRLLALAVTGKERVVAFPNVPTMREAALPDYEYLGWGGVALPAGARTVQLKFTDAAYEKGKILTLVCITAALVLLVAGVVADRRRPTPVVAA